MKERSVRWMVASATLAWLPFAASLASAQVLLEDLNGDGAVTVVAFGDSITKGTGDNHSDSRGDPVFGGYPARLEQALGVVVFNAGKGGEHAAEGADRIPSVLATQQPDFVILLEGANDVTGENIGGVPGDMDDMIDAVFATGAMPLLATLTPLCCSREDLDPLASDLSRDLRGLAQARGIPLVDFREAFAPGDDYDSRSNLIWTTDGLHPTPSGYDLMSDVAAASFRVKPPLLCHGLAPTIVGTAGDDEIHGTSGPDVIHGRKGNDLIFGVEGDDVVCGGGGNDTIYGAAGADELIGGKGDDRIYGGEGADFCKGGQGADLFPNGVCETIDDVP